MRQLNLPRLLDDALVTFLRFPFVLVVALIGSVTARQMRFLTYTNTAIFDCQKTLVLSALGLSLMLSFALMAERKIIPISSILAQAIGTSLLVVYWFLLPSKEADFKQYWVIQITLFFLCSHLLVSFSPYLKQLNINSFWQFNKSLFLGFFTAALFSGVLYLGLSLALLSIDKLFHIQIRNETYLDLFIFLAGIFNTWYFLYHVPKDFDVLDKSTELPQDLKVFAQYILLPLVAIYLLILYLYGTKILITWRLPIGWVSNLVIAFSVLGVLCFLLLYPYGKREENAWINRFTRLFYVIILPLLALLFVAICYRINAYGLTEKRYFVLLTGLWLLGISIYFIVSKKDNIALIPISLCIVSFLSAFGAWGAYSMSLRDQEGKLTALLTQNNIDISTPPYDRKMRRCDAAQISSILDYFSSRNENLLLRNCLKINNIAAIDTLNSWQLNEKILEMMRVPNVGSYYGVEALGSDTVSYRFPNGNQGYPYNFYFTRSIEAMPISQYDWMSRLVAKGNQDSLFFDKKLIIRTIEQDTNFLYFVKDKDIRTINLKYFLHQIKKYNPTMTYDTIVPNDAMSFSFDAPTYRAKIIFENLNVSFNQRDTTFDDYHYWLLIKKK